MFFSRQLANPLDRAVLVSIVAGPHDAVHDAQTARGARHFGRLSLAHAPSKALLTCASSLTLLPAFSPFPDFVKSAENSAQRGCGEVTMFLVYPIAGAFPSVVLENNNIFFPLTTNKVAFL